MTLLYSHWSKPTPPVERLLLSHSLHWKGLEERHSKTWRQVLFTAAPALCLQREFVPGIWRNRSLQFPYQVFRSALFPAFPPPGCLQCGVLFSCLPLHAFLLPGRIFFFFFFLSTLRRLLVFSKALRGFVGVFCSRSSCFQTKFLSC